MLRVTLLYCKCLNVSYSKSPLILPSIALSAGALLPVVDCTAVPSRATFIRFLNSSPRVPRDDQIVLFPFLLSYEGCLMLKISFIEITNGQHKH